MFRYGSGESGGIEDPYTHLRVADFGPAEISRPVREVKVVASQLLLQERETGSGDVFLLHPRPKKTTRAHLVVQRVILLGLLQNGNKLQILSVLPSSPTLREQERDTVALSGYFSRLSGMPTRPCDYCHANAMKRPVGIGRVHLCDLTSETRHAEETQQRRRHVLTQWRQLTAADVA